MKGYDFMKTTKTVISAFLALTIALLCFAGCAKLPEEPITTSVEKLSYVSPYGATAPAPENGDKDVSRPVTFIETINNVEMVYNSYYIYGKNAVKIKSVVLEDDGISYNADGYIDVEAITVGSRSELMKVGYTAYDAEGNIVRDTYFSVPLKGVKAGDTVTERRIDYPRETVKIVFHDYVEKAK